LGWNTGGFWCSQRSPKGSAQGRPAFACTIARFGVRACISPGVRYSVDGCDPGNRQQLSMCHDDSTRISQVPALLRPSKVCGLNVLFSNVSESLYTLSLWDHGSRGENNRRWLANTKTNWRIGHVSTASLLLGQTGHVPLQRRPKPPTANTDQCRATPPGQQ
jgi:hypothetical protein